MKKIFSYIAYITMFGFATASQGATVSYDIDSANDCAGYFGDNFEACAIQINGEIISPIIAKIGYGDGGAIEETETNTLFPTIDGSEFDITFTDGVGNDNEGTWSYTPDDANDPAVRFWVAKGGNEFTLFWQVADSEILAGGACYGVTFTLACLNAAEVVTSGDWSTPGGGNLSHITYYDTNVIPVPAAVWLFGSGLLGLVGVARRRA